MEKFGFLIDMDGVFVRKVEPSCVSHTVNVSR